MGLGLFDGLCLVVVAVVTVTLPSNGVAAEEEGKVGEVTGAVCSVVAVVTVVGLLVCDVVKPVVVLGL